MFSGNASGEKTQPDRHHRPQPIPPQSSGHKRKQRSNLSMWSVGRPPPALVRKPVISISIPVSSRTSRRAALSADSPHSMNPAGKFHHPVLRLTAARLASRDPALLIDHRRPGNGQRIIPIDVPARWTDSAWKIIHLLRFQGCSTTWTIIHRIIYPT